MDDNVKRDDLEADNLIGYEKKYIIYLDDDNSVKKKVAWIKFENGGVWIKLDERLKPFWIGSARVLKIKPLKEAES